MFHLVVRFCLGNIIRYCTAIAYVIFTVQQICAFAEQDLKISSLYMYNLDRVLCYYMYTKAIQTACTRKVYWLLYIAELRFIVVQYKIFRSVCMTSLSGNFLYVDLINLSITTFSVRRCSVLCCPNFYMFFCSPATS